MSISVRTSVSVLTGVFFWLSCSSTAALAQKAEGLFVTIPHPITSDAVARIKAQVQSRLDPANPRPRPAVVIFDFNPSGKPSATAEIGACRDLAQQIRNWQGSVLTVAFVHAKVSGHTVLPVLACKELVMSKEASIGEIAGENIEPLQEPDKAAYKFYLGRDSQFALIRKMYDRDVQLVRGKNRQTNADEFADAREEAGKKLDDRLAGAKPVPGIQDGVLGLYSAQTARDVSLAKAIAETRADVAERYGLPPGSVRDDPLQGRQPAAYRWTLKGDVDGAMRESVNRVIRDVRKRGGNVLILVINCGGNDLLTARGLADDLRAAQTGEDALQIIGFIPERAPDAGTVVALGCTDIVMTRPKADDPDSKEAEIGDFERYLNSTKPGEIEANLASIRELAQLQGYPELLIDGMFKKDLEIIRATGKTDKRIHRLMTREEFNKNQAEWSQDGVIKNRGQLLKLGATRAAELGLARFTVESPEVKDVTAVYGYGTAMDPDPGWLDKFAEFLRMPVVTVLLVVIGFTGLILELKVPGLTVPGIIAALCFILVFWSQSRFSGQTFVLALLLFMMGLVLVGIEIFVLPGFGACGIFGILCMLAGLGLVTLDKIPETGSEWVGLGVRVSQYLFAMMGAMGLSFLIARFLPKMPYANRMILKSPMDHQEIAGEVLPGAGEAAELLGAIGTTNTTLRPAGVVKFGDKFVDVVSDGGFVPAGTRVQVILVEGTRIVVKEV